MIQYYAWPQITDDSIIQMSIIYVIGRIDSFHPSAAYMRQWIGSALAQKIQWNSRNAYENIVGQMAAILSRVWGMR